MTMATDTNTGRIARTDERLATKADLTQMEARITLRMIGMGGVIIAAVALIVRFL